MVEEHVERRLTAILAVDVAGYSRLMGADEEGTLARLKAHRRELIDPKISEHQGRIVKTTGDGMLVDFPSVVNAMRCAVEVQRSMIDRNVDVPKKRRIEFRIGINIGDIIVDGGDIYGDGVNVAARLEGLAEPGAICVSGQVQENTQGKLDIAFEDAGEQQLKNIARPVRVYRVHLERTEARPAPTKRVFAATQRSEQRIPWQPSRRIIALSGALGVLLIGSIGVWLANMPPANTSVQSTLVPVPPKPPPAAQPVRQDTFSNRSASSSSHVETPLSEHPLLVQPSPAPNPSTTAAPLLPAAPAPTSVSPEPKKIHTVVIQAAQSGGLDAAPVPPTSPQSEHPLLVQPSPAPNPSTTASVSAAEPNEPLSIVPLVPLPIVPGAEGDLARAAEPMSVATAAPVTGIAATPSTSGGYAVQLTSQRSEAGAQAAFRALQAKFPDQLSGRELIVRRTDFGTKGVFYRALVGPFASMEEAAGMCSSLKAAGGNCIVQRN